MVCSKEKIYTTWHWELVPKHNIKTRSRANAYVLLVAIRELSNPFSKNEQMVERDEERRFKAKNRL